MATIAGFYRVRGFDHLVRCVTDAPPDQYGQRLTVWQDGCRVFVGRLLAPELEPLESASDEPGGAMGRSERAEIAACVECAGRGQLTDNTAGVDVA